MDKRRRLLFLSAVFIPLTFAVGAIFVLVWILSRFAPEIFVVRSATWLELVAGLAVIIAVLMGGFLVGTLVLVILWRSHVPRSTLENIVTRPHVPVFSQILIWFFARIYPIDR